MEQFVRCWFFIAFGLMLRPCTFVAGFCFLRQQIQLRQPLNIVEQNTGHFHLGYRKGITNHISSSSSSPTRRQQATDADSNDEVSVDPFMASLRTRVDEVTDRASKLPIIILDAMLPRQVLNITVPSEALLIKLIKTQIINETPYFGMLGLVRSRAGKYLIPLTTGVQVDIIGKPKLISEQDGTTSIQILLKGSKNRFKIDKEVVTTPDGWMEARVNYTTCVDDESESISRTTNDRYGLARAMSKAQILPTLVEEWIHLARSKERHSGQIDSLLIDIGTIPTPEEPTNISFWVGALINPLPAMGVALEIRPSLLIATTAEERVDIAVEGITKSIRHMRGEPLVS
jgi:ATP-dependent protease La (LON) substrate-binding domain